MKVGTAFLRKLFRSSAAALLALAFLATEPCARAERIITASTHTDQLKGMWLGELVGNYAGRQVEGLTTVTHEGATAVSKPITEYQVQWNTILQGQYYTSAGVLAGDSARWLGDDDTCLEFVYGHALQSQPSLSVAERTSLWDNTIAESGLYFANRQSWFLVNRHGQTAEQAGMVRNNPHSQWTIDAQITTEALGAISPGMRSTAAALAADFGGITNSGFTLHAAQFYAAMYAEAPFAQGVESLVASGLAAVPEGSWTRSLVERAVDLYEADRDDNGQLDSWLTSRNAALSFALQRGRDSLIWTQSASNTVLTTLAILYGQGNFKATVEYGVRGGHDSDCNPATAGGLVGMMKGYDAVIAELTTAGFNTSAVPQMYRPGGTIPSMNSVDHSLAQVATMFQTAAETQLVAALGSGAITGTGSDRVYHLPDVGTGADLLSVAPCVDPAGPRGLVKAVLAGGGSATVTVRRNGVVQADNAALDRSDQSRLIDGVTDVSCNGVLPFRTYTGSANARTDSYELGFGRPAFVDSVVLHEGDILLAHSSRDPRDPAYEPYGGYFTTLSVEVLQGDQWVTVTDLLLSEPLDPYAQFQSIELTFDRIAGTAVRVSGQAGGQQPFTSLTELEAFGLLAFQGDADMDGDVDWTDFWLLRANYGRNGVGWASGDCNFDGTVDNRDYLALRANYGRSATTEPDPSLCPALTPEPGTLLLLLVGGAVLNVRNRKPLVQVR